jgi:hypothetical protein
MRDSDGTRANVHRECFESWTKANADEEKIDNPEHPAPAVAACVAFSFWPRTRYQRYPILRAQSEQIKYCPLSVPFSLPHFFDQGRGVESKPFARRM